MSTGTLIADTVRSLTEGRLPNLKQELTENGFDLYKEELWDIFSFIEARKKLIYSKFQLIIAIILSSNEINHFYC